MNPNTGGPAFPTPEIGVQLHDNKGNMSGCRVFPPSQGMTLLDWMAGQALVGMCASPNLLSALIDESETDDTPKPIAIKAYEMAEAMLAEKARREATGKQDLQIDDHFRDATKMIPGGFAEDTLRRLAHDVLHSDIKDAAEEAPLTWCAEQVRARVNTLEALNRELVDAALHLATHAENSNESDPMRDKAIDRVRRIAKAKEVA